MSAERRAAENSQSLHKKGKKYFYASSNSMARKSLEFCWRCCKTTVDTDGFTCSSCHRVFHRDCLVSALDTNEPNSHSSHECPICYFREEEAQKCLSRTDAVNAQNWILHQISERIKLPVFETVREEIEEAKFAFVEDLLTAVKQMYYVAKSKGSSASKSLRRAFDIARDEFEDFRRCLDCFFARHNCAASREHSWFANVCGKPHKVVWAKLGSHPLWPAKVYGNLPSSEKILVKFFGEHNKGLVSAKNCFVLTRQYPLPTSQSSGLKVALQELQVHIKLLKSKFPELEPFASCSDMVPMQSIDLFYSTRSDIDSSGYHSQSSTGSEVSMEIAEQSQDIEEEIIEESDDYDPSKDPKLTTKRPVVVLERISLLDQTLIWRNSLFKLIEILQSFDCAKSFNKDAGG